MAPSMEIGISSGAAAAAAAEEETRHLLGVGPALIGSTEAAASATRRSSRRACRWLPLHLFARDRDRERTKPTRAVCKPMDAEDFRRHRERRQRVIEQGHFERCSGCFSFLPAPRTLFFFELNLTSDFDGIVTCIPLDEAVTEGYSVLGFPIWWADCICRTCYRRFDSAQKTPACGHDKAERICEMCHHSSAVLHPFPGEFAYGYREYLYRYYY